MTTPQFADPLVFAKGRRITVAGVIVGTAPKPIGESKVIYPYPVVRIKQIVLWSISEYTPPDFWSHGEPLVISNEERG